MSPSAREICDIPVDQNFFPGRIPFYQGTFQKGLQFQEFTFGAPRALKITRRGKTSRGSL
jgi:hypothetical protein